jgi:streptogramin lyase
MSIGGLLAKFDGNNWVGYPTETLGVLYSSVTSVAFDGSGNKWIGTTTGGLAKYDGTNWTWYNISNSNIPNNYVQSVTIDNSGNIWIGTYGGGLAKFNGTNWTLYNTSNSKIPSNNILYSMVIDGSGNKWMGTFQTGLVKFDDTNFTVYNSSNSGIPAYTDIFSIAIDGAGNKWIGTSGSGLVKFDGINWALYNTTNSGLPNNNIRSIVIDGAGNKWIAMYNGGVAVFKEGGVVMPAAQALNGQFDYGTQSWNLSTYATGAAATYKIDTNSVISGHNSAAVQISQTTGTDWHIQFWQWLSVNQGHKYTITFKAKASAARSITLALQKGASPYTTYLNKAHNLTTQVQTFTDEVTMNTTDLAAKLQFYLGGSTASVWIDDITIVDNNLTTDIDERIETDGNISVLQNYPNPFTTTTTIKYKVTEPGFVSLKVFNAIGTEIATLINEKKPVGEYPVEWNAAGLAGGIYFCRFQNGSNIAVKKMIVQK